MQHISEGMHEGVPQLQGKQEAEALSDQWEKCELEAWWVKARAAAEATAAAALSCQGVSLHFVAWVLWNKAHLLKVGRATCGVRRRWPRLPRPHAFYKAPRCRLHVRVSENTGGSE